MAEKIVDAAISDGVSTAAFFLTDQYVIYDYTTDRVRDGVHPLTEFPVGAATGFPGSFAPPGPTTSLDTGLRGKGPFVDFAYFFRNSDYMRVRTAAASFDPPDARSISAWNLPGSFVPLDAAFNGALNRDGFCYFFKGNQYVRYSWAADSVDSGYPKPISNMVGIPAGFASNLDAAVDGAGAFESAGYFFKGEEYLRFRWVSSGEPHVDQDARPIQGNWPGLLELLLAGKAKSHALEWLRVAQARLASLAAGTLGGADLALITIALATHFHTIPTDVASVQAIRTKFAAVEATLRNSAQTFRFRTDDEVVNIDHASLDAAYAAPWPPSAATRINITRFFKSRSELNRVSSIIHEAVHVNDAQSATPDTHISEWYVSPALAPLFGLIPQADNPSFATRYDLMSLANALHNPASYATFARHVFHGVDTRELP